MTKLRVENKDGGGGLELMRVSDVQGAIVLVRVGVHDDLEDPPVLPEVRLRS